MHDYTARLGHLAGKAPDLPAVSEWSAGGWTTTSRAGLRSAIATAAHRATRFAGPVIMMLDGSLDSIAVLLGLLTASVDVLCLEQGSSHLADEQSVVWRIGAVAVVEAAPGGPGTAGALPRLGYRDLLAAGSPPAAASRDTGARPPGGSGPCVMLLTSGAAGEPRVVRQTVGSVRRGAALYGRAHDYGEADRILLPVPIAHSFGLVGGLLAGLGAGAELLVMPRFSLSGVGAGLDRGATVMLGSPLLYSMAVKALPGPLRASRLRVLLSSGGPLPAAVAAALEELSGGSVRQVYGSTETGLIACRDSRRREWTPGSVGVFAAGVQWRLLPQPAGEQPRGRPLAVRTTTMFTGYADPPSEPVSDASGFYDTGDLAEVTESGEVFLVGRKSTFVNVGGKKVNPRRVERVVLGHPDVADAYVFGTAEGEEQVVHAAVVPSPAAARGRDGMAAAVVAFCRTTLAPHETPRRVHVLTALPRTPLGAVDHTAVLAALPDTP